MTAAEKIAKAERIASKLVADCDMAKDFAEAVGLYMVLTGCYKLKQARMPVFLAGQGGADRFRAQIMAAA